MFYEKLPARNSCAVCTPTSNGRALGGSASTPVHAVVSPFNFSHSGGCVMASLVVLIYIFLMTNVIEHLSVRLCCLIIFPL